MGHAGGDHGVGVEREAERDHDGDSGAGAAVIGCERSVTRGRESRAMATAITPRPFVSCYAPPDPGPLALGGCLVVVARVAFAVIG